MDDRTLRFPFTEEEQNKAKKKKTVNSERSIIRVVFH